MKEKEVVLGLWYDAMAQEENSKIVHTETKMIICAIITGFCFAMIVFNIIITILGANVII